MPATEQTWRDSKRMHLVFGISSVVMFVSTIWMLAADHNREWKEYQRKFETIENWSLTARSAEQETQEFEAEKQRLQALVDEARVTFPPPKLVEQFLAAARPENRQIQPQGSEAVQAEPSAGRDVGTEIEKEEIVAAVMALEVAKKGIASDAPLAERIKIIAPKRDELLDLMRSELDKVRFVQDRIAQQVKFGKADVGALKSLYDIGVRDEQDEVVKSVKVKIDTLQAKVDQLDLQFQATSTQRKELESILGQITADEDSARKSLKNHEATLDQMQSTLADRTKLGRGVTELPILDAFNSPLKINQIWLPELTLFNNFKQVARFDRCTTCHLAIDKTAPGSAVKPGYPAQHELTDPVVIALPPELLDLPNNVEPGLKAQTIYGFKISQEGLINADDVLIDFVWPNRPAARAGLQRGDVLTHVELGGRWEKLRDPDMALQILVEQIKQTAVDGSIRLEVRRGFPHPYSSHPRLDLFVGSLSPHKLQDMGCTICHDGQGSATAFEWANHTPNDPQQAHEWARKYGWFDNHHWIFPMQPQRFVESGCLKCHFDVVGLGPSDQFPDPSAPKLTSGYDQVLRFGCYGCHEINGYSGPNSRIGPDMRTEPQYYAAAQQLAYLIDYMTGAIPYADRTKLTDPQKTELLATRKVAEEVSWHPDRSEPRQRLFEFVNNDATRAKAVDALLGDPGLHGEARALAERVKAKPSDMAAREKLAELVAADADDSPPQLEPDSHALAVAIAQPPLLGSAAHGLADVLKDSATPGTLRKVGPSLRYVDAKLEVGEMMTWILNPQGVRRTSKMPRFFGLQETHHHLPDDQVKPTEYFERVEARAITTYLFYKSKQQSFEYAPAFPNVSEDPDYERGKAQFEVRGCLGCHQQKDYPGATSTFGPNLTDLAKKLTNVNAKKWLRSWLLNPARYSRRTKMPNLYLEPEPLIGPDGKKVPRLDNEGNEMKYADGSTVYRMTDPAADLAEYLLGPNWRSDPTAFEWPGEDNELTEAYLDQIAVDYLKTIYPTRRAEEYIETGIPERLRDSVKGAEVELVGDLNSFMKWVYVGRRSIGKYGCFGCHDVPGFEGAKPIGTGLADWGRKDPSKLAFEHILHYVEKQHGPNAEAEPGHEAGHGLNPEELQEPDGYFVQALMHNQREGFLRQKLLQPRSYDYEKIATKPYNDRLKMPQFAWGAQAEYRAEVEGKTGEALAQAHLDGRNRDIEEVMTFVLGLLAEPAPAKYVYKPDPRRAAIVQGEIVLQKYNCAGCHVLELDRWDISFAPENDELALDRHKIQAPPESAPIYPFLEPHFTPEQIAASLQPDSRGRLSATLRGMPRLDRDGDTEEMVWVEEEDAYLPRKEFEADFQPEQAGEAGLNIELWQPAILEGNAFRVKDPLPTIAESMIETYYPGRGGAFARLLMPLALELVRKTEPTASGPDAWAWGPPPLVGQGRKTQEDWLRQFLLNPHPIRPGVLLRMPQFNLTPEEAEVVVEYFAARDNPNFPDHFLPPKTDSELDVLAAEYKKRLPEGVEGDRFGDALNIVIHKSGCTACHSVNDKAAEGSPRANAPNLANVYKRLKPGYMKRWIAKPFYTLPYTKMQELIPYKPESPHFGGFWPPVLGPDGKPLLGENGNPKLQEVYHGTSQEQLEALVDLLANFDRYLKTQTSIKEKITAQNATSPEPAASGAGE
jgi:cytochrome c2